MTIYPTLVRCRPAWPCGMALFATLALAGCSGLQLKPPPMAIYDLGVTTARPLPSKLAPAQIRITTPPWLSTSAMQYRLIWQDPDRRRSYAESRWASPASDLLSLALDRGLSAGSGGLRCRLQVDLDEFIQVFDTPAQSHVDIVVRIGLLPPRSEVPLAQTEMVLKENAASIDAAGGVAAHRVATDRLITAITEWLVALDRDTEGGLNSRGRCGA